MLHDEEVADNYAHQDDENLHEGDVEIADHVQLREGVLCGLSNVPDRVAGSAEGLRVHYCTHIAVLAEVLTEPFVTETAITVATVSFLLELMHKNVI